MTTEKAFVPELLSPAGSLKICVTFAYGADAVTLANLATAYAYVTTSLTTRT